MEILSPWHSPVNYAPYTLTSLKAELAARISRGIRIVDGFVAFLLDLPGVWPLARRVLALLDRRPGRLYSFIAEKS